MLGVSLSRIATAVVERIMKRSGAKRVSKDAVRLLAKLLEETAIESSRKAVVRAKKENRKKIVDEDVTLP